MPLPSQRPLYYTSLLREVVALSPQSVAPAMGKSVRRIYHAMKTGRPEGEVIHRFADWFSIHLSNFNFSWAWKEWIPDMTLTNAHAQMAFARRIVELELRLSYFQRIKDTLPAEMQQRLLPPEEPAPNFTYANAEHPFNERAMALIQSFRARATAEVILAEMESFKRDITPSQAFLPSDDSDKVKVRDEQEADLVIRDIVIQAILNIGSRSFSHFLNVVERYHALLRQLSSTPDLRLAILASTARFWAHSNQWITIVFDKLLQYRIVEPADVVAFVFETPRPLPAVVLQEEQPQDEARFGGYQRDWSSMQWYDVIKLTVEKVNGRVDQVRKRFERLEREEAEEAERKEAAKAAATSGVDGEEDSKMAEASKQEVPEAAPAPPKPFLAPEESVNPTPAQPQKKREGTAQEAKTALEAIQAEQRKVLVNATMGFVKLLKGKDLRQLEQVNADQENDEATWQAWWIRAWYRDYLRAVSVLSEFHHMDPLLTDLAVQQASRRDARDHCRLCLC